MTRIPSVERIGLRRCHYELLVLVVVALLTTLLFWFTTLDQQAAGWFFHPENGRDVWPVRHWWLWQLLYDYAFPFTVFAGVAALLIYLLGHLHDDIRGIRRKALYILLVIVIGPGVLVNLVVKDHWGRPRPMHTREFDGQYDYVPPLKIGHTPASLSSADIAPSAMRFLRCIFWRRTTS